MAYLYVPLWPELYTATSVIRTERPHRDRAQETTANTINISTSNKLRLLFLSWWWLREWRWLLLSCCSLLVGVVVLPLFLLVVVFAGPSTRQVPITSRTGLLSSNERSGVPYHIIAGCRWACLQLVGRCACCFVSLGRFGSCAQMLCVYQVPRTRYQAF